MECILSGCAGPSDGVIPVVSIPAPSLAGSVLPNEPEQPALVFLPPGYASDGRTYPVVYYLPGFTTSVTEYVDGTFGGFDLGHALHDAMASGSAEPFLLVVVNGRNELGGSFYVNSPVTGDWEDFVVRDAVAFVETRYRVRADRRFRAIAGESMGGAGALRLAMRHSDVFGSVFALSPALFDERGLEEYGILGRTYLEAWRIEAARMRSWPPDEAPARFTAWIEELYAAGGRFNYRRAFTYAYGAAFSPDPSGPPYVASPLPERFEAGFGHLEEKVRDHVPALRSLAGIGIDVGQNDHLAWIPRGARRFAALLAEAGIHCTLTEHEGGHIDRFGERVTEKMIPFFSRVFREAEAGAGR